MSIDLSKLDLNSISGALDSRSQDIVAQSSNINKMFEVISSSMDGLDADFLDDKIFNGSSGDLLSKSTLTMDKILEMNEDEIQELLKNAESSDEVEEALQKQKQLYSQQV